MIAHVKRKGVKNSEFFPVKNKTQSVNGDYKGCAKNEIKIHMSGNITCPEARSRFCVE